MEKRGRVTTLDLDVVFRGLGFGRFALIDWPQGADFLHRLGAAAGIPC